jgi:hypothetical protein
MFREVLCEAKMAETRLSQHSLQSAAGVVAAIDSQGMREAPAAAVVAV